MKQLLIEHNNISYEFRLLEVVGVVEVIKDGKFTYLITPQRKRLACNCPAGTYRHSCWHTVVVSQLLSSPTLLEPWTLWAEEAGILMYGSL